ncbi:MAG: DUF2924 domain-containing protein [Candidatus Hatepunaea meridiana]|nr:DUF2924 domain-containing protein [Candidatus Hatepunaea meridiana]
MTLKVLREVNILRSMTVKGLRGKYIEVFGEETRSCNKDFLRKRIAWRVQALAEGDLSERACQRAKELGNDADIRIRPQICTLISDAGSPSLRTTSYTFNPTCDQRIPMPGAILSRQYKGTTIRVMVLEKGFEYNGEVYRSLTAVTRAVTGSRWNGFHFFGLRNGKTKS